MDTNRRATTTRHHRYGVDTGDGLGKGDGGRAINAFLPNGEGNVIADVAGVAKKNTSVNSGKNKK